MGEQSSSNNNLQGQAAPAMKALTSPDNTRLASSASSKAHGILWRARRDVAQHGGPLLDAALGDTFTARILGVMLAEADNYINKNNGLGPPRDGGLLPHGWAQTMLLLINKAEAQVVNARRQVDAQRNGSAAASTTSSSSGGGGSDFLAPPPPAAPNNRTQRGHNVPPSPPPSPPLTKLVIAAHSHQPIPTSPRAGSKESRRSFSAGAGSHFQPQAPQKIPTDPSSNLAPHLRALAGLQMEVQALLSVLAAERMRLNSSPRSRRSRRREKAARHDSTTTTTRELLTSEAAFLAVLAEEEDVLLTTQDQISHLSEWSLTPPAQGAHSTLARRTSSEPEPLEQRLGALPVQLQAIFNMQCRERELGASRASLDEGRMLRIVTENQNRTEMVCRIQRILAENRAVRLDMCLLVR